ncbi:DMT family transporter [Streptomyces sp. NPDC058773]|uniref:EamA family transporter n=1 Tax=Streptomyces sp. NPDC058773 TaxID=3346632 RepID=UPI0036A146DA
MLPGMTRSTQGLPDLEAARGGPAVRSGRLTGVAMMCGSGLANQTGAATGALAFSAIGPAGVVAVRQWVAGLVLLAVGRPRLRGFTWRQWWPVLCLAMVFATMNLTLYTAIDRIGLGLAVTLEFLGPLAVAMAASRRPVDLLCALVAGSAVAILTRPQATTDYTGIAFGLVAAVCWASYILLNRLVGARLPGVEGSAAAAGVSALLYLPIGITVLAHHPPSVRALGYAATAGVLSSAVPFLADLLALRRVPARFFGIFMSVNPVLAALVGLVVLDQTLRGIEWLAVAAIVVANAVSILASGTRPASRVAAGGSRPLPAPAPLPTPAADPVTPRGPAAGAAARCGEEAR